MGVLSRFSRSVNCSPLFFGCISICTSFSLLSFVLSSPNIRSMMRDGALYRSADISRTSASLSSLVNSHRRLPVSSNSFALSEEALCNRIAISCARHCSASVVFLLVITAVSQRLFARIAKPMAKTITMYAAEGQPRCFLALKGIFTTSPM